MRRRLLFAASVTLLAVIAAVTPAAAAPYDIARFVDQHSFALSECPGVSARVDVDFSVFVLAVQRGRDGLVYYTEHDRGTRTITNLVTGKAVTEVYSVSDKDLHVRDDRNGTFTITTKLSGQFRTYGPDGKLLLVEAGPIFYDLLIDNKGTPQDPSDDELLTQSFVREAGRHTSIATFCELFPKVTAA